MAAPGIWRVMCIPKRREDSDVTAKATVSITTKFYPTQVLIVNCAPPGRSRSRLSTIASIHIVLETEKPALSRSSLLPGAASERSVRSSALSRGLVATGRLYARGREALTLTSAAPSPRSRDGPNQSHADDGSRDLRGKASTTTRRPTHREILLLPRTALRTASPVKRTDGGDETWPFPITTDEDSHEGPSAERSSYCRVTPRRP